MTLKQKATAQKLLENPRLSVSEAMRQSGYSPETAKVPSDLTRSKGWKELMEKHLPDDKLLTKHEEALEATKWNDFTGEREEDHMVRLKAVDLAYKLKGRLNSVSLTQVNIGEMGVQFISDAKSETP